MLKGNPGHCSVWAWDGGCISRRGVRVGLKQRVGGQPGEQRATTELGRERRELPDLGTRLQCGFSWARRCRPRRSWRQRWSPDSLGAAQAGARATSGVGAVAEVVT